MYYFEFPAKMSWSYCKSILNRSKYLGFFPNLLSNFSFLSQVCCRSNWIVCYEYFSGKFKIHWASPNEWFTKEKHKSKVCRLSYCFVDMDSHLVFLFLTTLQNLLGFSDLQRLGYPQLYLIKKIVNFAFLK